MDDLYTVVQGLITLVVAVITFVVAIWKLINQSADASKSQRDHDQTILNRLVSVIEQFFPVTKKE